MNYYGKQRTVINDERIEAFHIGKSSYGWEFNFYLDKTRWYDYPSLVEYIIREDIAILTENGEETPLEEFLRMVETKQVAHPGSHNEKEIDDGSGYIDGYYFSAHYFC